MRLITPVVPFASPKLRLRLALKDVAGLDKGFTQAESVVTNTAREICKTGGVGGVGFDHELCLHPGLILIAFRVDPVVYKNELGICFRLISQTVLGISARGLKGDLLPAPAVESITGTEIPVEFKTFHLLFQLLDSCVRIPQLIVRRRSR